jgi:hypothetical protein
LQAVLRAERTVADAFEENLDIPEEQQEELAKFNKDVDAMSVKSGRSSTMKRELAALGIG